MDLNIQVQSQVIKPNYALYHGDSVELIQKISSNSIGLSLFSPPFASLYTYSDSERDMGNNKSDAEFYQHFDFLVNELYRVIMPGRHAVIHCMDLPTTITRDGYIGMKDFPGEMIRMFQSKGFVYHSRTTIWKCPVVAVTRTHALGLLYKQLKKDSSKCRTGIPDYLIVMKKPGVNPEPVEHMPEDFPVSLWQKWASPVWMDINPSCTLQKTSAREEKDEKHICPLQLDVIERAITLWSNKHDIVYSPFAGIGSEGFQAIKQERKYVGMELKESYYNQMVLNLERAAKIQPELALSI